METILEMANRIGADLKRLSTLDDAPVTRYAGDTLMVKLDAAGGPAGGAGAA